MNDNMVAKKSIGVHKIQVTSRSHASITGVKDVLSFDPGEVLLETGKSILMIRGQELHVKRLTLEKGEVDIDGKIDSLTYSEDSTHTKSKETFINRLFK